MYVIHVIEELEGTAAFKLSDCFVLQTSCKLLLWKGIALVCPSQQETLTINPGGIPTHCDDKVQTTGLTECLTS